MVTDAQSTKQHDGYNLSLNGQIWDVSNLSPTVPAEPEMNRCVSMPIQTDSAHPSLKLYPSRNSIRRLLDRADFTSAGATLKHPPPACPAPPFQEDFCNQRPTRSSLPPISSDIRDEFLTIERKPEVTSPNGKEKDHDRRSTTGSIPEKTEATFTRLDIEVSPGHGIPMIGADETAMAVQQGNIKATSCFGCESDLYCTTKASCVYCPLCKAISPVSFQQVGEICAIVGLGLTEEHFQTAAARMSR